MTNLWLALACKVPCAMCYTNNRSCYTIDMSCDKARKHLARKHLATSTTHPGSTCGQSGRYIRVGREEQTRKGSQLDVAKLFCTRRTSPLTLALLREFLRPAIRVMVNRHGNRHSNQLYYQALFANHGM